MPKLKTSNLSAAVPIDLSKRKKLEYYKVETKEIYYDEALKTLFRPGTVHTVSARVYNRIKDKCKSATKVDVMG